MSAARRNFAPSNMSRAQIADLHLSWLQALPGDGPFLTIPVLTDAFPLGLDPTTPERAARFKASYNVLRAAAGTHKDAARSDFIRTIATDILDWGAHYDETAESTERFAYSNTAFGTTTQPAFVLWPCDASDVEPDTVPNMLGFIWPHNTVLNRRLMDGWASTPIDRVAATLRHHNIPLGIVTSGRWWAIVWAPRGTATGHVLCDTHAMLDDRQLLDAFTSLLSRRRHLAVADNETLPALLDRALQSQEDLTENLSIQVRRAVEMLVDAVGHSDKASDGVSLAATDADHVYEGAVTVVMRLVFMLAAEERQLLPGDDDFYASNYGIAGLADRLIDQANSVGEDVLARQGEAFPQVLAATRVVHDGVRHQTLNIKGYGGSVFDPNKYPWLEGRQVGGPGKPVHIDDRTMLHILKGLTRWQGRKLAYRTLDVEQIGYVYEGLLDHTALNADTPYLALKGAKEPELSLDDIEQHAANGATALRKWLKDQTGLTPAQLKRALDAPDPDGDTNRRLTNVCGSDPMLAERIAPYLDLIRVDERTGDPVIFMPGDWFVTASSARSDAGSYYTPRSLAEEVVTHTLDALVYSPGPLDTLNEDDWRIVKPQIITSLKVADIAMGSGAFLVAADRYLADRLIEAITAHPSAALDDPALAELARITRASETDETHQIDSDADEATTYARRLVAARCLYGADINPTAVEMAKLSLWLATAAKDQPFGFLDHHLTAGDTLLGLTNVGQLEHVHTDPARGATLHASTLYDQTAHIRSALQQAIGHRTAIESIRVVDLRDVEQQQSMLTAANSSLADFSLLADAITAETFAAAQDRNRTLENRMSALGTDGGRLLDSDTPDGEKYAIRQRFRALAGALNEARPEGSFERIPTQWVVRFPEVFMRDTDAGFDAIIGNPPYLGGQRITGAMGTDYRNYLVHNVARGRTGSADLVVYFLIRAAELSSQRVGLLTTNTVGQGVSREVGLDALVDPDWAIVRAVKSAKWPSKSANLEYAAIYLDSTATAAAPRVLDGLCVRAIETGLRPASRAHGQATRLAANSGIAFIGSLIHGMGFTLTEQEASDMISGDPRNAEVLFPYLNGQDLNSSPNQEASRWVINFLDWPMDRAATYERPFSQVEGLVKPERMRLEGRNATANDRARHWWRYGRRADSLYKAIGSLDRVVAIAQVSNTLQPVRVSARQVLAMMLVVFATDSIAMLGLIASGVHGEWVRRYASSMRTDIRYTPSDVFETFPLPEHLDQLEPVGEAMEAARTALMSGRGIGLTAAYNLVKDEAVSDGDVVVLREAHVALDRAVLEAYGWSDLDPDHDFYGTEQGVRFTMEPTVTLEILDRLLELNHGRYANEVDRGLHGNQASIPTKARGPRSGAAVDSDALLFE